MNRFSLFFLTVFYSSLCYDVNKTSFHEEPNDDIQNLFVEDKTNNAHEKILSRQKRYLIFPEGSSLQVVFDQIIPIVDYNNYLILGITVALAWELPSKRPSELIEEVKEKLNDGTLGLRKDESVEALKYVESPTKQFYNDKSTYQWNNYNLDKKFYSNWQSYPHSRSSYPPINHNIAGMNFYTEGGPVYFNSSYQRKYSNPYNKYIGENMSNNWRKYSNPYNKYIGENMSNGWNKNMWGPNNRNSGKLGRRLLYPENESGYEENGARKHRIYPVFGKRSIDSNRLTAEEKFHLRYHRSTRHRLYLKIEKYLQGQGKNGLECVLKALCETGQQKHKEEPDTFLREILRAIFTIPSDFEPVTNRKHQIYDEAYSYEGNCSEKYPLCPASIWSQDFLF